MAKFVYGKLISTGKIISIDDIPEEKKERKPWDCVCPKCGLDLIAKKGAKKEAHFAHKPEKSGTRESYLCNAFSANESALHQMAKEIIEEELLSGNGKITAPPIKVFFLELEFATNLNNIQDKLPSYAQYKAATSLQYTKALVEPWFSGFRPDVVIETDAGEIWVEICVTHKVQQDKIDMAAKKGIPVLEIDIGDYLEKSISREELRDIIINSVDRKEWLVRPNETDVLEWGRKYYENLPTVYNFLRRNKWAEEAFQPERYTSLVYEYSENTIENTLCMLSSYHFVTEESSVPFFCNIPITGEIVFKCNRQVWQSAIFDRWIYFRKKDDASINTFTIFDELQKALPIDHTLAYGSITVPDLFDDENLPYRVISTYLRYLERLGFITIDGKWATVLRRLSTTPPNEEFANEFDSIIKRLGNSLDTPDTDKLIRIELDNYYEAQRAAMRERMKEQERQQKEAEEIARQNKIIEEKEKREREAAEYTKRVATAKEKILAGTLSSKDIVFAKDGATPLGLCTSCGNMIPATMLRNKKGYYKGICDDCLGNSREREKPPEVEQQKQKQIAESISVNSYNKVKNRFTQQKYPIRDLSGRRWVQCESCGEIKPETEFGTYGGENHVNLGTCYKCLRRDNQ